MIPVAPLSAEQASQEVLDRVRRLKANGLAEFSDPPPLGIGMRWVPQPPILAMAMFAPLAALALQLYGGKK